jgi:hypothetical protein
MNLHTTAIEFLQDASRLSRPHSRTTDRRPDRYHNSPERLIESFEHCNEEHAEIPFDWILDRVTGSRPSVTDYILEELAKCPNCPREIFEKTLVEPA